jgi:hypothetical protein
MIYLPSVSTGRKVDILAAQLWGLTQHWLGFRSRSEPCGDPLREELEQLLGSPSLMEEPKELARRTIEALALAQGKTCKEVWHKMRRDNFHAESVEPVRALVLMILSDTN